MAVLTYWMEERSEAAAGAMGRSRSPLAHAGVASTTASATRREPSLSCSAYAPDPARAPQPAPHSAIAVTPTPARRRSAGNEATMASLRSWSPVRNE